MMKVCEGILNLRIMAGRGQGGGTAMRSAKAPIGSTLALPMEAICKLRN
jgi:hypothetical protein